MSFLCIKTIDEPRVYREYSETPKGYEVTLPNGDKLKFKREEVTICMTPEAVRCWITPVNIERITTLQNRIRHIKAEWRRMEHELEREL